MRCNTKIIKKLIEADEWNSDVFEIMKQRLLKFLNIQNPNQELDYLDLLKKQKIIWIRLRKILKSLITLYANSYFYFFIILLCILIS